MRVLLSEGSGLTSRQVATRLGALGHHVEILSSTPFCLTRFTRHVRALHRVPRFADDPMAWFAAANRIARLRAIDVLLPTQEQVAVLSAQRSRLEVATVVPDFAALRRVQDKIEAWRTLHAIGIPQPASVVVRSKNDLAAIGQFPVFVKRPISTASAGVRRAATADELVAAAVALGLGAEELLVQTQASGPLAMVQALADHGRLVAHHANLRVIEGIGGGAAVKESIRLPKIGEYLQTLVQALDWHGPSRWMSSSPVMDRWSSTSIRGWSSRSTHSLPASISSAPCSNWPGAVIPRRCRPGKPACARANFCCLSWAQRNTGGAARCCAS